MKNLFLVLVASALSLRVFAAEPIPPELVGEWVSPGTKFDGEAIVSGGAVYLGADGFAAIICTPPPIGMAGTASYDAKKRMLTLKLKDNSSPPQRQTVTIIYDPNAQTLTSKPARDVIKENLKRRKDKVPKWVIEETK